MKSLKALTTHLSALELINDNFDSWAEGGTLEYSGSQVLGGLNPASLLYRLRYTAVFSWEGWGGDSYALFAEVMQWLVEQDYDFDVLGLPGFDADILDDQTADLDLRIRFDDAVYKIGDGISTDKPEPTTVDQVTVCGFGVTADA